MSKKCSVWMAKPTLSSTKVDLTMIKLIGVKGDKQNHCKDLEETEAGSSMSNDVDVSPVISNAVPSSLVDEKKLKDPLSTSKRNHKHRHHHRCRHNRRHRVKKPRQDPTIVYRQISDDINHAVDAEISDNISNQTHAERIPLDEQKVSSITRPNDQAGKPTKGNIPLQSIENKLVSHRRSLAEEAQVGNYSSFICSQPTSPILPTCCTPQIEQICCEDNYSYPSSTTNYASNSCILPQHESFICLPQNYQQPQQQQRQQLFLCTNPNTAQDFICSPSAAGQPTIINQAPLSNSPLINSPSQPVIYMLQPSVQQGSSIIIQQQPQVQPQMVQIIQAPQTQPQQIQFIPAPQTQSQQIQFIQAPPTQPTQYLQISSTTPQMVGTIQAPAFQHLQSQIIQTQPSIQTIQVPPQAVVGSPQILYQRPYDPIAIPVHNQQLAIAQSPIMALSQPSYAPPRMINTLQAPRNSRGPHLFQNALVQTVATRTGLPVLSPNIGNHQFVQPSMFNPTRGAALASTASALLNTATQSPTSGAIVPLSAGSLLIPFQPSGPQKSTIPGVPPRTTGFQTSPRNFENIERQIQQRAQLLSALQQISSNRAPSRSIQSANRTMLPSALPSLFAQNAPIPASGFSSSGPIGSPRFSPNVPIGPSRFSPNVPIGPPRFSPNVPIGPPGFSPNVPIGPPGFSPNVPIGPPRFSPNVPIGPPRFSPNVPIGPPRFSPNVPIGPPRFSPNVPIGPPALPYGLPRSPSIISSNIPQPPVVRFQPPNTIGSVFSTSSSSGSRRSTGSSIAPVSINQAAPSNLVYSTPSALANRPVGSTVAGQPAPYQSF